MAAVGFWFSDALRRPSSSSYRSRVHHYGLLLPPLFRLEQRASLVNVKIKWVKDRALDAAVSRERHLRPALQLIDSIASEPGARAPSHILSLRPRHPYLNAASFMRRYPSLFHESVEIGLRPGASTSSTTTVYFGLTTDALLLHQEEQEVLKESEHDLVDRLRKLLMLTSDRALPLHAVDQLRWDMSLPFDYRVSLLPRYPHFFEVDNGLPDDDRPWLRLISWDDHLAVSELQKDAAGMDSPEDSNCLSFPVRFTRGFGLKRKCMAWLAEWQRLPYTSPYVDASGLDPRTDVAEKRIVGVFHELLHLTLGKKTDRWNFSNLRKPLCLPQKFTKVFERHPGIFYLSQKLATQTVVLREAYGSGRELLRKHPLMEVRERYITLMKTGLVDDSSDSDSYESGEECEKQGSECNSASDEDSDEL